MTMTRPAPVGMPASGNGQGPVAGRTVNVGRTALGVILVVGLGAAFGLKYTEAGHRTAVLAVARAVPAGQAVTAADITEARVSADASLRPVPASERDSVIGRTTAVALVPGTLLTRAALSTGAAVPAGRDVVGLSLKAGQVPLGIGAGDAVVVVRAPTSPGAGADPGAPVVVARNARVLAVQAASTTSGATTVVSVMVDAADAVTVAAAGATGQASVVVEGGR